MADKQQLLCTLPIMADIYTIRPWTQDDVDSLAAWPSYPAPYEAFNLIYRRLNNEQWAQMYRLRNEETGRLVLIVDAPEQRAMMYVSLIEIDWNAGEVKNMAIRLHPDWCDKGVGTLVLRAIGRWIFNCGILLLRLDVAAPNARAIRCYENVGFVRTSEFWHDDENLGELDINQPQYEDLRQHVRFDTSIPQTRFYWMELTPDSLR